MLAVSALATTIAILTPTVVAIAAVLRYLARLLVAIQALVSAVKQHGDTIATMGKQITEHEAKDQQVQRELVDRLASTGDTLNKAAGKLENGPR